MERKRIFQVLLFILTSVLEVRVRADIPLNFYETVSPLELPEKCIESADVCTITTKSREKYELEFPSATLTLSEKTTFSRVSSDSGILIAGRLFVRSNESVKIDSSYGYVQSTGGDFIIEHKDKEIKVTVLKGKVDLSPKGHEKPISLDAGLQNKFGRVDVSGKSSVGLPQAFDYLELTNELAPIFNGTRVRFFSYMREMKETHREAVIRTSEIHKLVVVREIASQEDRRNRAAQDHARWLKERDYLRALLFKKTFE